MEPSSLPWCHEFCHSPDHVGQSFLSCLQPKPALRAQRMGVRAEPFWLHGDPFLQMVQKESS